MWHDCQGLGTTRKAGTGRYVALFEKELGFSSMATFGANATGSTASNAFFLWVATK
jgi:hypothetical protein